ncbi:MAG: O-antigen ligase family protein [Bacteroidales bacterium]|nr:O-antigen ligase family protein [Bacteroidales bacterium]
MFKHIIHKAFYIFSLASIIHIPILNVARIYLVFWFVVGILFFILHRKITYELFRIHWVILPIFLLWHVFSLSYTNNLSKGLFDIEVKLSFLIVPLLFYLFYQNFKHIISIRKMKYMYLISLSLLLFFLIIRALVMYNTTKNIASFYYNDLSAFYHPSYLAMYITVAVIFLLDFLYNEKNVLKAFFVFLWLLVFLIFQYFLSSKAGILTTSLVLFIAAFYFVIIEKLTIKPVVLSAITLIFLYIGIHDNYRFRPVSESLKSAEQNTQTTESNAVRILVWKAGVHLISQHWLLGVGCGDIKDVLLSEYAKRNMQGAIEKKLNLHNQYLETWLSVGIMGLLLLLFLIIYPLYKAICSKNLMWMLFIITIATNFLAESMLNTQAGVIFITYFYFFFIVDSKVKKL